MVDADFLNSAGFKGNLADHDVVFKKRHSHRFFNRELSWISFNWRVLEVAENSSIPILERVRFLAISASNLDEFYSVRVAGLQAMVREKISFPSADGLSPSKQLSLIKKEVHALIDHQQKVWRNLLVELKAAKIAILDTNDLSNTDLKLYKIITSSS